MLSAGFWVDTADLNFRNAKLVSLFFVIFSFV